MPEEPDPLPASPEDPTQMMTPPTGGGSILPTPTPMREVIGDFEVLGRLGAGGMGAVYRARQISLDRMVALKILPAPFVEDADAVARFQREARVAAGLSHANLVRVYAAGEADGCHYIAMELIEGEDLGRRLKREGKLIAPEALRICAEVARGLQYGWEQAQLVHRDIKPGNIFLSENGAVKLGDLGLAKLLDSSSTGLTQTGTMMGTPHYISPEQARGDREIDFRADIYSLGCTLYQMLAGETPYRGGEAVTIIRQHLDAPLPAILKAWPQCPIPLARLVGKMLKKSRHERPASYAELLGQIESVWAQIDPVGYNPEAFAPPKRQGEVGAAGPAVQSRANAPGGRLGEPSLPAPARSKLTLSGGLAAAVLVLGILAFVFWPKEEPLTEAQRVVAQREAEARARANDTAGGTRSVVSQTSAGEGGGSVGADNRSAAEMAAGKAAPSSGSPMPSAEPWQDVLRDPAMLSFTGGVERLAEGLRFADRGSVMILPKQPPKRDGAVRLRSTFGGTPPLLRARRTESSDSYQLGVDANGGSIAFSRWESVKNGNTVLRNFPLREALRPGQDYELELHAIGQTFTVKFNGETLGTVTDGTFAQGHFGVMVVKQNATPTVVKSLEVLDLNATGGASSTPAADSLGWKPLLTEAEWRAAGETKDGAVRLAKGFYRRQPFADGAVRARFRVSSGTQWLVARNQQEEGHYKFGFPTPGELQLNYYHRARNENFILARQRMDEALRNGETVTLELRAEGQHLTGLLNGKVVMEAQDARLGAPGDWGNLTDDSWWESLEVRPLGGVAQSTPSTATKDAPFVNSLRMRLVPVPITGGATDGQRVLFSIWETRVQDYNTFRTETGRVWPSPGFDQTPRDPAVNVSWEDAVAFCAWLTERERNAGTLGANEVYRLPSDHEWSCAAGIGEREDAAKTPGEKDQKIADEFPWGSIWPPPEKAGNYWSEELRPLLTKHTWIKGELPGRRDGFAETAPVGSFAANRFGLHELGGNVWEWCEDWFDASHKERVLRGAAWFHDARSNLGSAERNPIAPAHRHSSYGFRVVLAPSAPSAPAVTQ